MITDLARLLRSWHERGTELRSARRCVELVEDLLGLTPGGLGVGVATAGPPQPGTAALYPSVTSALCAANAPRTSCFSGSGTLKASKVRASSAATSSNSSGEIRRLRWASSRPRSVRPGRVAEKWKGPPATSHTQSVRMNFRPGSLPRLLVCHSRRAGFCDF